MQQSVFNPLPVFPALLAILCFGSFSLSLHSPSSLLSFLDVFYLILPSLASFPFPPLHHFALLWSPDLHRHILSCLALSSLFLPLSIPCLSLPTPSHSPPRPIDVPSPIPHLRGPPIISFEQVLINDIHRLMNNSPKREQGRRGREREEGQIHIGRGDEQRDSR